MNLAERATSWRSTPSSGASGRACRWPSTWRPTRTARAARTRATCGRWPATARFSPFGGANPRGWTAALNDLGIGPYVLVSLPTLRRGPGDGRRGHPRDGAAGRPGHVARPARVGHVRLRVDRRPARPSTTSTSPASASTIRSIPHGSSVWGTSPKPNTPRHARRPWPSSSSCATARRVEPRRAARATCSSCRSRTRPDAGYRSAR